MPPRSHIDVNQYESTELLISTSALRCYIFKMPSFNTGTFTFQRFLQVVQNKAQAARLLQEVQSDEAAPGEDRARQ